MKTLTKSTRINKARRDIVRVLERYRVTLPEVTGATRSYDPAEDELVWRQIEPTYRRIEKEVFAKFYPGLAKKTRRTKKK